MKRTLEAAEQDLSRARADLLRASPEAVNSAVRHLEKVAARLGEAGVGDPQRLSAIRRQVMHLWTLLESARAFYTGLARLRVADDSGVANYTRSGQTCAPVGAQTSLITHG